MFYFNSKDHNNIKIQCGNCNNIMNYKNNDFHAVSENYCIPNIEIRCDNCNESTKKIIYSKNHELGIKNQVHCPKCNSSQVTIQKRGWKITSGFLGSSKNERVCMNCLYKW
jgi:Zn finger protein HypA/HybF involved in hydrogenase expression